MSSRIEIILALICVILTAGLYSVNVNHQKEVANGEFRRLTEDGVHALRKRMLSYLQSIKGTAAFLAASDHVSVGDFESYIDMLDIPEQLPGIGGIGMIVEVPDAELDQFAEHVHNQGQPEFEFRRLSDAGTHYIIKLISPKEANVQALGLDITFAAEPTKALEMARDTNTARMTPPRQLVQAGSSSPGLVLYQPIYSNHDGPNKPRQFLGWIQASFVAEDLVAGLTTGLGDSYQIHIVDGASFADGRLVFDGRGDEATRGKYMSAYELDFFGRTWGVAFNSTAQFDIALGSRQPLAILIAGLAISAFLISVLRTMRLRGDSMRDIANLRQRQIEAREEETRAVVQNSVISVLLLDATDNVIFANQATRQCFGYSEAELNKMAFAAIAQEVNRPNENYNAIGHTKSGQEIELDLQMNRWTTSEGHARTTVIIRDLTAQNSAERELRRNKTLYDLALQGSEIGVFDVNLNTGSSEVSETWCRIMGYEDNCNGMDTQKNFLSRIHPEDLRTLKQADADCIAGKTERSIAEYRLKTRDGDWSWMKSDAVIVEWGSDGKASRMIGTQTDVTALRHDRNALEVSEKRFRQVLVNAPIGMALMDDTGNFIGVNNAFANFAGVDSDELIATGRLVDLIPYDERKKIYAAISKLMTKKDGAVYTAEHRVLHAKGEDRWGLLNVSWSFDKNKGGNFFIAQVIDITDQKRLSRVKDEFVSTVSHELRTPLTSIKGALGLLMASKDNNFSKSQARLIDIASANADRLTDIVNDILDLEKISSGEVTFDFADTDLTSVLDDVVREMSPFAETHDSFVEIDTPQDPLMVFADRGRTQQVLTNLISNACKYSDPKSKVMAKAEQIGDMAIVYIQNIGPGVPDNFRSRIFQAFSQADSSDTRAKGGTGLGLNISRQIVLRHGGQIGFESTPGGVTVFWFTIPLSTSALHPARPSLPLSQAASPGRLDVLHVEDDCDFAEIVSGALRDSARVTHAKSIAVAKQALHRTQFNVVILDWSLSDGDASSLLDDIVRNQSHARIIALSADSRRKHDPRLFANLIKSRTEISTIVASVNQCHSLAS